LDTQGNLSNSFLSEGKPCPGVEESFGPRAGFALAQEGVREVPLRVEIDEKGAEIPLLADGRKQPGGVRLTDTTFEVEDGEDRGAAGWRGFHAAGAYQGSPAAVEYLCAACG